MKLKIAGLFIKFKIIRIIMQSGSNTENISPKNCFKQKGKNAEKL